MEELLGKIQDREIKHKINLDPEEARQLDILRIELSECLDRRNKEKYRFLVHQFYEQGNKCSRLLANQIKKQQETTHVHKITANGKEIEDTKTIAAEFHRFYTELYNIQTTPLRGEGRREKEEIEKYIKDSKLPTLPLRIIKKLEGPITTEEICKVIKNLPNGKSPGPDGLTNVYYKKYSEILVMALCNYFNKLTDSNPLLPEALAAHVTVIPKAGKDPQFCANYRPISLLNSDTKLLAKILAIRLEDHLAQLVHRDQTGFMKGRETKDNTIRALHVLIGYRMGQIRNQQ